MLLGGGAFLQFHLAPFRYKFREGHDRADSSMTAAAATRRKLRRHREMRRLLFDELAHWPHTDAKGLAAVPGFVSAQFGATWISAPEAGRKSEHNKTQTMRLDFAFSGTFFTIIWRRERSPETRRPCLKASSSTAGR